MWGRRVGDVSCLCDHTERETNDTIHFEQNISKIILNKAQNVISVQFSLLTPAGPNKGICIDCISLVHFLKFSFTLDALQ